MKIVSNILKKAQGRKFEKEWIQFIDFIVIIPSGIIILNYLWNILIVTEVLEQPANKSPVQNVVAIREWRHANVDKQRKLLVDVDVTPPRGAA